MPFHHVRVTLDLAVKCPVDDPTVPTTIEATAERIALHASQAAQLVAYSVGEPVERVEHEPIRVPSMADKVGVAPSDYARAFVVMKAACE